MYLDGHREILAEVVSTRLPRGFFSSGWPGGLKKRGIEKALQRGLAYPDLPCGRAERDKKAGSAIHLRRPLLCGVMSLIQLMSPRRHQYSEMFQSHLGALAHVHAMAPAHRSPTAAVAHAIVSHAMALGLLFWRCFDPAFDHKEERPKNGGFWLGILLHTLTDSYADAHAIRVPNVPLDRAPPPDEEQERVMRHSALLYDLAGRTLDAPLTKKKLAIEIENVRRIKKRGVLHLAQQHQTYLLFVMHRQTDRSVRRDVPGVDRKISAALRGGGGGQGSRKYDIRAFSYYPTQPQPAYHALRDRLKVVRDRPEMWDRMLGDCAELIRIFKDAAIAASAASDSSDSSAASDSSDSKKTKNRKRFLTKIASFMLTGPMRLSPGAASRPPMNYSMEDADRLGRPFGRVADAFRMPWST